jgi:hypothetical protein
VETRDVSDADTFIVCQQPTSIPLYRLGPHQTSTGTPDGYALRLLVEPGRVRAGRVAAGR